MDFQAHGGFYDFYKSTSMSRLKVRSYIHFLSLACLCDRQLDRFDKLVYSDNEYEGSEVNTIELMVFVDSAFMKKYSHLGSRGVDQYVATVVGIMADLYQHPSIGKPLKEW